jgi:hypothetical protein
MQLTHAKGRVATGIAAFLAVTLIIAADQPPISDQPRYSAKGELLPPENYREWVFLSSGLGMNYSPPTQGDMTPPFGNVFVTPGAYKSFMATGRWPDKTMFVLEVRASESKGSINKSGHYQGDLVALEAEVKDESRFAGKWAFFSLGKGDAPGKLFATTESCYSCHAEHGAVDNTFVQFYPTLLKVARERGTMKEGLRPSFSRTAFPGIGLARSR